MCPSPGIEPTAYLSLTFEFPSQIGHSPSFYHRRLRKKVGVPIGRVQTVFRCLNGGPIRQVDVNEWIERRGLNLLLKFMCPLRVCWRSA